MGDGRVTPARVPAQKPMPWEQGWCVLATGHHFFWPHYVTLHPALLADICQHVMILSNYSFL